MLVNLFFQSAIGAFAQETKKITLQEAIDLALKNNLDFKSTQLDLEIQKNKIKIANKLQNPDFGSYLNHGTAGRGNPQQIGVFQVVELGKRDARKKLELANMALVQERYEYTEFNLKMNIRQAYVEYVAAKSVLHLLEKQQKLFEDLLVIAKRKKNMNKATDLDVTQAEIALGQLKAEYNTANVNVQAARYKFNKVLNIKGTEEFHEPIDEYFPNKSDFIMLLTPPIEAEMPGFVSISDSAANKRYDLQIAKKQIDIAQNYLRYIKVHRIPDLQVGAGYLFQPNSQSEGAGYLNGGFTEFSLINLPVFYNYSPEIKNAQIELEQAKINYDSVKDQAIYDLSSAYEKFTTAKMNLKHYDKNVLAKSDMMMEQSKKNYESGSADLTNLIVMERCYQTIKTGYINALCTYYTSWIEFLKEVNSESFSFQSETL